MRKLGLLAGLLFATGIYAADGIPEVQIQDQDADQSLCVQKILQNCISKCDSAGDKDCVQLCNENAKNECRQAGE
ncbi:hypothetical protein Lqui_2753 [Legionella quinlivanii]|uniref:Uncharacterized protein n=1 Tax=Legionella quinlivanii TaxID=45073 RepID=A0A0W0XLE3_9GAMM|nr:hypothetical protein [Legionella quinlivanii]KTD45282.1 hypothetical protein Lqui_2753 [Legionella quinlivanii]MCW8450405.1 hypothetical protein [Legionella quinlivanii]SEG02921.1 hypothetical protein SAMN02746093_01672 [Legionella quinlivanii DSM 21216]STY11418.1 Uncharacterised protein [Legionella quinlivanii]